MDTAVIHHDDVVALERRNQTLLDIGEKHLARHGSIDHHRCGHFMIAQGGYECDCLPCSERNTADHPLASRSSAVEPHEVGADRGLVDKHEAGGIKHALFPHPTPARSRDISALPLG